MKPVLDFNLQDILDIFLKWKKALLTLVTTSILVSVILVFGFLPKKYLATAVCLPGNPVLSDPSYIFNENIQNLYATYGSNAELDRLISTAQLDTLYRFAVNEFKLRERYKVKETGAIGLKKTILKFKKHYNIEKTFLGELKIHTWDKSAIFSAKMANTLLKKIGELSTNQSNDYNGKILKALKEEQKKSLNNFIKVSDSLLNGAHGTTQELLELKKKNLENTLTKYNKLIDEFSVATKANAPSIQIQELALAQAKPDKPKKLKILLLSLLISMLFGILMVFVLENRSKI